MKKFILFFALIVVFPVSTFAMEDCSVYTTQITKLQSNILDLYSSQNTILSDMNAEVKRVSQLKWDMPAISFNNYITGVKSPYLEKLSLIDLDISNLKIEIERQKLKYNTCIENNYTEEKSNQVQGAVRKAQEDTAQLQVQIEQEKKKKTQEAIKKAKLARIEVNKKRMAEIRKKAEEKRKKNISSTTKQ